ncbi:MAG: RNA polymerase sigma factor [Lacunisphaera sp.]
MDYDLPLIQALQGGDDSALNELINRHREPLFYFVFRYLRDEAAARDVVQETFVRVYFKAKKFKPQATVKTWVYSIALNLCHDQGRRLAKRRTDISLNAQRLGDQPAMEISDGSPGPAEQAAQGERFSALKRAIDRLPHKLKSALVLFSLEGHSQIEAAELLGTTPKAVELRVAHAKQKLREILASDVGDLHSPRSG